jgi:hypothetical protein
LDIPGFRPEKGKIIEIEEKLLEINPGTSDTVVMDMGTAEDGLPTPAFRTGHCSYHIRCSLTTTPPTTIKKVLETCSRLGNMCLL